MVSLKKKSVFLKKSILVRTNPYEWEHWLWLVVTGQSKKLIVFNSCNQVVSSYKVTARKSLVSTCSCECYHFLLFLFCVLPYFPIERVDTNRQLPASYLATDSLRLGRSCKRALMELSTSDATNVGIKLWTEILQLGKFAPIVSTSV